MPAKPRKIPGYRLHKPTDQAVVRLDSRDHYLGRYGTEASREAYQRLVAEWLTTRTIRTQGRDGPPHSVNTSVNEVILDFLTRHAESHYRDADGKPTGELANYRHSLRPLKLLYGVTPAGEFSPLKLKAVRKAMIDTGLSRSTVNQRVGRIVRVFKWAASEELVTSSVHQALKTVSGLSKGRSEAKETERVRPVSEELIAAVRPHVAGQVWAMIELQWLTGMRPGEVVIMRSGDLVTSGRVWVYTPPRHKTQHHGRDRTIPLGPRAQAVIRPWLRPDPTEYLFSPKEAMQEFRKAQRRLRKTRLYPSQRARTPKSNPRYAPGERYTTRTYCHAIGYGCKRAGVSSWHPNQLRHSAATRIRREFDLDAARAALGHSDLKTSEIYAERDATRAAEVALAIG